LHVVPCARQVFRSQQPPLSQALSAQQGWFGPPQGSQVSPLHVAFGSLQSLPGQHFWPLAPQGPQVPLMQTSPLAGQVWPAQQGSLGPPHDAQTPETQTPPSPHAPPRQQGWPTPPQVAQRPDEQASVAPVHLLPSQQVSPRSPQSVQVFSAVQSLPGEHAVFTSSQRPACGFVVSQQPTLHVVPLQQGMALPPQPEQSPLWRQMSPFQHFVPVARQSFVNVSQQPVEHSSPVQQGLPGVPQVLQTPPLQTVPAPVHVVKLQQGSPGPPQDVHAPPTHVEPPAVHWLPEQQAWPRPPQEPQLSAVHTSPFGQFEPAGRQS
jgi:hypothetical protein